MIRTLIALFFGCFFSAPGFSNPGRNLEVRSPDGELALAVEFDSAISFLLIHEQDTLIHKSTIYLQLDGDRLLGENPSIRTMERITRDTVIRTNLYKKSVIVDHYNEVTVWLDGGYGLVFRVYNEGAAYRFFTELEDDYLVYHEEAQFNMEPDDKVIRSYVNKPIGSDYEQQFFSAFENLYDTSRVADVDSQRLAFLPLLVERANGKKVCITEADLEDYPGMFLARSADGSGLSGVFAPYPEAVEAGGYNGNQLLVKERAPYIAIGAGSRQFPWRVMAVSVKDSELLDNDLVYKLASPSRLQDEAWIQPGKVAWEWWNDWNVRGVDFKTGINNETYKQYIDFAAAKGLEYVILDDGWSVKGAADLFQVVPEIDIKLLASYAKEKGVGLILWAGYRSFDQNMEEVCKHYAALGIKGFKIDFVDRDDQVAVNFYYRAAETAARHQLLLTLHGMYKPTGIHRTYPNVLNFEGIYGLENMKVAPPETDLVTYDVTFPFIRMLAGPVDYTPGAMRNVGYGSYYPLYSEPMSQGTRTRQLAHYIISEAPLAMLSDSPTNYLAEEECVDFIASVPVVWDRTVAIDGKVGEYIIMARRKDDEWFLAAMTNWEPRELRVALDDFIDSENYTIEMFEDGMNADRFAQDYSRSETTLPKDSILKVSLAPGGGFAARITPKR